MTAATATRDLSNSNTEKFPYCLKNTSIIEPDFVATVRKNWPWINEKPGKFSAVG